jgi:hypothetical protein
MAFQPLFFKGAKVGPPMHRFEVDLPFCGNPDCVLHVTAGMPGVCGRGNWASLSDGRIVGRQTYCGLILCDDCVREWQAVGVILPDGEAMGWR